MSDNQPLETGKETEYHKSKEDPYLRAPTNVKTVTTQAEYDALQPGEEYIEDGKRYRKPKK